MPARADLRGRLRAEILRGLTRGHFQLRDCARALGLSTRTLERRLSELGAVFRDEVDSVRREHAGRVLRATASVDEAAVLLGYSERASFHRACVRWFGKTPAQVRAGEV